MLGQLKKTWHKRFCQLFRTSNYGIKRVEIYDNQEEAILQSHSPRIITLDACIKIAPSNQSHVFVVVTKSGIHYFGCYSEMEMTHWITAFQLVAFKDSVSNQTIEENNDLYCTSGEGVFSVKVVETDASKRCGLEARNYTLVIAAVDMKLMDGDMVLFTWPYRYIRRYGYRDGKFIFEAGRKCESGEGSFRLEHTSQQEIFRCMYAKMRSMKKLLNEENSPNIECNDAQYHAALSMEAGSRAALPPSPNNSSNLIDMDFGIPQNSQKTLTTASVDSTTSSSRSSSNKSKPAKPPRKYVFGNLLEKKNPDSSEFVDLPTCGEYITLSQANSPELSHKTIGSVIHEEEEKHSYDLVEIRNDAWKTHGIDSVHHTERVLSCERQPEDDNDDLQYEIMMPMRNHDAPFQNSCKSKPGGANDTAKPSAVPSTPKLDESDYDKLEHFGSASKHSQPAYKYTNPPQGVHSNASHGENSSCGLVNPAWSNYDIVEDMSAIRLADDSHLGYGIIRKKTDQSETSAVGNAASGPQHKVFNNSEYAIVSKPKRV